MGTSDKIKHKADEWTGAAKERVGDATDNRDLQAEGATQKLKGKAGQVGEHLKDAGRDARDALS